MASVTKYGKKAAGCCGSICLEFRDFLLRGNVVDLAVAVVVGGAFQQLINSFVAAFITPLIGMIGSPTSTSKLSFTVRGSVFNYGLFINQLISFIIICTLVFFVIVLPLMNMMNRFFPMRICPECLMEDVPAGAKRCRYCCSTLTPLKKGKEVDEDEDVSAAPSAAPTV